MYSKVKKKICKILKCKYHPVQIDYFGDKCHEQLTVIIHAIELYQLGK